MPGHRQGQKVCVGILTALLGDVTFTAQSMNLYNAEQFVKPGASLLCLGLPGLGLTIWILLPV